MTEIEVLKKKIKILLLIFIAGLIVSGVTAFPLETELRWITSVFNDSWLVPLTVKQWLINARDALIDTNQRYPFLAYGYDWLAFAHLVIAVAFIGPWRDPVKNIWVIEFGMIACIGVIPLALIAGAIRSIPFYHQLIDCSFGVFGIIPLLICHKLIKQLERLEQPSTKML